MGLPGQFMGLANNKNAEFSGHWNNAKAFAECSLLKHDWFKHHDQIAPHAILRLVPRREAKFALHGGQTGRVYDVPLTFTLGVILSASSHLKSTGESMNVHVVSTLMAILIAATAVGCAPAPFIPAGKDTYTITQTSAGGIFKSMSSLRAEVIGRSNEFAKGKGKVAERVSENESPAYPGHMPSFTYTFRLVSDTALAPSTENAISNRSESNGVYGKLLELDDLRQKGIITQKEFESEKAKILSDR